MVSAWAVPSVLVPVVPVDPAVSDPADWVVLLDFPEPMAHRASVTTLLPRHSLPAQVAPAVPVVSAQADPAAVLVVVDEVAVVSVAAEDVAAVAVAPNSAPMVTPNLEIASIEDAAGSSRAA